MTLMAGFDIIAEISMPTLLKLIKKNLRIGSVPANPPFEMKIKSDPTSILTYDAQIIVYDMLLDLLGDNKLNLTLIFNNTSIIISSPLGTLTISGLDGNIKINMAIQLADSAAPNQKVLAADLGSAKIQINYSSPAETKIANALFGTPFSPDDLKNQVRVFIEDYVQRMGLQKFGNGFAVVPGQNGGLFPLQFEKLEIHNIGYLFPEALGFFGILSLANHSNGDHNQKTSTSLTSGHDVSVEISPEAFHSFIFCPALAQFFNLDPTDVSRLPSSCGSGGGIDKDGLTFRNMSDSFTDGHIDFNGSVEQYGDITVGLITCSYHAYGPFHGTITLSITDGKFTSDFKTDPINLHVDIRGLCNVVATLIDPLGIFISNQLIQTMTISTDNYSLALKGISMGILGGGYFDQVEVVPEGSILNAILPMTLPRSEERSLDFNGSVVTTTKDKLSECTYHILSGCMFGDYPYIEYGQHQTGNFNVITTLFAKPTTFEFRLEYTPISSAQLNNPKGTVTLLDVNTHYSLPLPGGSVVKQPVHIDYQIDGDTVYLTNRPSEGTYKVYLVVKATDTIGSMEAFVGVQFDGNTVEIDGDYQSKMMGCFVKYAKETSKTIPVPSIPIPRWAPVNYPSPDAIIKVINFLVSQRTPEAAELLVHAKLAQGNSFYRALFSVDAPVLESAIKEVKE